MYYVYVLFNVRSQKFYIGFSANLRKRIEDHDAKRVQTTRAGNYRLIYYEAYYNKADAVGREKFLKGGSGHRYLYKQLRYCLSENI